MIGENMEIKELKRKYPKNEFYQLKAYPQCQYPKLENLEDMLSLSKKVGYIEVTLTAEETSDVNYTCVIETFLNKLQEKRVNVEKYHAFRRFLNNDLDITNRLQGLCKSKGWSSLALFGLDFNVMYEEEKSGEGLFDEDIVLKELDNIFEIWSANSEKSEKEQDKNIHDIILCEKERYMQASTMKEQEMIIREVQMKIKLKYNIDGRQDIRANKAYIKAIYENN